jgi:hypothetical protein
MMQFYDYLYYDIYKFYSDKEKGAASSSAGIVGGLQAANVLVLVFLFYYYIQKSNISTWLVLTIAIFFQITTYIRYIHKENNSIKKLEERWSALNENQKRKINLLNITYIASSIILFFGVAIFLGGKK